AAERSGQGQAMAAAHRRTGERVHRRVHGGHRQLTAMLKVGSSFALLDVTVVDGHPGPPIASQAVIVRDRRIVAVQPMSAYRRDGDVQEINLDGHYVMPGLIDAHVHLAGGRAEITDQEIGVIAEPKLLRAMRSVYEAQQLLKRGFTAVRDVSWNG